MGGRPPKRRRLGALLVSSLLAACSGGGHAVSPVPSTPATGASPTAKGRATVRLAIPRPSNSSSRRRREFVSPSTDGVSVQVTHTTNSVIDYNVTVNFDVSPGSTTNCTGGDPQICTLQIPAPIAPSPDADTFVFTLYDQAPLGSPPAFGSSAQVLGSGTVVASIDPSVNNSITAYIGGTPTSVAFAEPVISGDGYLGFSSNFGVDALDADQNVILGGVYDPYNPAFGLGVTDQNLPAGSTTLSIAVSDLSSYSPTPPACNAAATGATSVTTCRSSDVLSFVYLQPSSAAFNTAYYATVATTSPSLPSGALDVSPIYVTDTTDTGASGGPLFTQGSSGTSPSLALNAGTGTVTLFEPGPIADGLTLSFSEADNGQCGGIIATGGVTATSPTTYTIAADGSSPGPGLAPAPAPRARALHRNGSRRTLGDPGCALTFTDNYGGSVVLDVTAD